MLHKKTSKNKHLHYDAHFTVVELLTVLCEQPITFGSCYVTGATESVALNNKFLVFSSAAGSIVSN